MSDDELDLDKLAVELASATSEAEVAAATLPPSVQCLRDGKGITFVFPDGRREHRKFAEGLGKMTNVISGLKRSEKNVAKRDRRKRRGK